MEIKHVSVPKSDMRVTGDAGRGGARSIRACGCRRAGGGGGFFDFLHLSLNKRVRECCSCGRSTELGDVPNGTFGKLCNRWVVILRCLRPAGNHTFHRLTSGVRDGVSSCAVLLVQDGRGAFRGSSNERSGAVFNLDISDNIDNPSFTFCLIGSLDRSVFVCSRMVTIL